VSTWNSATLPKSNSLKYFKFFTTNLCTKQDKFTRLLCYGTAKVYANQLEGLLPITNKYILCTAWGSIHSFIILIYVIFGQPGECADTKVQIEVALNENMDMRSAVHRAFFLGILPKITKFMATFLGQPVRRSSWLVTFHGAI